MAEMSRRAMLLAIQVSRNPEVDVRHSVDAICMSHRRSGHWRNIEWTIIVQNLLALLLQNLLNQVPVIFVIPASATDNNKLFKSLFRYSIKNLCKW